MNEVCTLCTRSDPEPLTAKYLICRNCGYTWKRRDA